LGVRTIGDLQRLEAEALRADLGALAEPLIELAHGRDESPVEPAGESKSLSAETTFAEDLTDLGELERQLLALAERVAERLRAEDLACRTVTLKVRFTDFRTLTRSATLNEPTHSTEEIHAVACALLRGRAFVKERAVRLLGIATSHLCRHADRQLDLFAPQAEGQRHRLDHVLDQLRRRLGDEAVHRARLLARPQRPGPSHSKDKG